MWFIRNQSDGKKIKLDRYDSMWKNASKFIEQEVYIGRA